MALLQNSYISNSNSTRPGHSAANNENDKNNKDDSYLCYWSLYRIFSLNTRTHIVKQNNCELITWRKQSCYCLANIDEHKFLLTASKIGEGFILDSNLRIIQTFHIPKLANCNIVSAEKKIYLVEWNTNLSARSIFHLDLTCFHWCLIKKFFPNNHKWKRNVASFYSGIFSQGISNNCNELFMFDTIAESINSCTTVLLSKINSFTLVSGHDTLLAISKSGQIAEWDKTNWAWNLISLLTPIEIFRISSSLKKGFYQDLIFKSKYKLFVALDISQKPFKLLPFKAFINY